jgi:hypothetical protein
MEILQTCRYCGNQFWTTMADDDCGECILEEGCVDGN